jgi:hypothetical protein
MRGSATATATATVIVTKTIATWDRVRDAEIETSGPRLLRQGEG